MGIIGIGNSDVGRRRTNNEDSLLVDNELGLFIVCDGMGGHAGGDVASGLAVDTISKAVRSAEDAINRVRRGQDSPATVAALLCESVQQSAALIYERANARRELAGMGTTATVVVDLGSVAVMAHVGDSRVLLIRDGQCHQLSLDHTMVEELVKAGALSREDANKSPYAHALTRAVGNQPSVKVDSLVFDVFDGDRIVLYSDGLTEYVDAEEIERTLASDFEEAADALIEMANERGGHDNTTVIALRVDAEEVVEREASPMLRLDVLHQWELLDGLTLAQTQRVLNACDIRHLAAGDSVVSKGDKLSAAMHVVEGTLAVRSDDVELGELRPGDSVSPGAALVPRLAGADAVATAESVVIALSQQRLDRLAQRRPWLGLKLYARLTHAAFASNDALRRQMPAPTAGDVSPADLL